MHMSRKDRDRNTKYLYFKPRSHAQIYSSIQILGIRKFYLLKQISPSKCIFFTIASTKICPCERKTKFNYVIVANLSRINVQKCN